MTLNLDFVTFNGLDKIESRHETTLLFAYAKTNALISCTVMRKQRRRSAVQ